MHNKLSSYILFIISLIVCTYLSLISPVINVLMLFVVPMYVSNCLNAYRLSDSIYTIAISGVFALVYAIINPNLTLEYAAVIFALIMIPGVVIGLCFKKKFDFNKTMLISVAVDCSIMLIFLAVIKYLLKINITESVRTAMYSIYFDRIDTVSMIEPQLAEFIKANEGQILTAIHTYIPGLIPFVSIAAITLVSLIRYALCKISNKKLLISQSNFADGFDKFRLNATTALVTLLCVVVPLLVDSANVSMIAVNVVLVNLFLYFLVAVSLIEFKLKQKNTSNLTRCLAFVGVFIGAVIMTLVFPVINIGYLFIFIGILDSIFDFRKLKCNKDDVNEE